MAVASALVSYIKRALGIRPMERFCPAVPDVTVSILPSKDRMRALMRGISCAEAAPNDRQARVRRRPEKKRMRDGRPVEFWGPESTGWGSREQKQSKSATG